MQKVLSNTFTKFKFPSNLQLNGINLIYTQTTCSEEENKYHQNLMVYHIPSDSHVQLTTSNQASFKLFENKDTVLFTQPNKENEKGTSFFKVDLNTHEIHSAFDLDINVYDIQKYKDGQYVILGDEIEEDSTYQKIERIPFYLNGVGFIYSKQPKLYIYDVLTNCLKCIVEDKYIHSFDLKNNQVVFVYNNEFKVASKYNQVGLISLNDFSIKDITPKSSFSYSGAYFFNEKIITFGSDLIEQGINDNRKIYRFDLDGSHFELFVDIDLDLGNSVGTDTRFGSNASIKVFENELYFSATVHTTNQLFKVDKHGNLSQPITLDGCIEGFAISKENIFISAFKDLDLTEIYNYNTNKKITNYSNVLNNYTLSNIETITFENDGIEFEGYVIKPIPFNEKSTYPALLEIHGGPKTAYGTILHHEMQLLANEGYFVFFMNPRGSSGRGVKFSDIRGKYGTIDYEDLMKFTDVVLNHYPQIDSTRLGVLGGSYGGFMTNWIVTHTNRFKAANTQRCISNWISFYGVSDIGYYFGEDQTQSNPWDNLEKMWEASPLKHVRNCETPLLIIHSDADYRCPLEQAYQLFTALQLQNTPTKLVVFKNENHDLSRTGSIKNRIARLDEIVDWFKKFLK